MAHRKSHELSQPCLTVLSQISTWTDTDAGRMKKVLESGEIRTAAQWRLATEYRDTVDEEGQRRIDDLIGLYEAKRDVRRNKAAGPRSESKAVDAGSKITSDDLAFADVLRLQEEGIRAVPILDTHGLEYK